MSNYIDDRIQAAINERLFPTVPEYHCRSCYAPSNNPGGTCRKCVRLGHQPNPALYAARKMGWRQGWPTDILDVLGLTADEIDRATPEQLAALWDQRTSGTMARSVTGGGLAQAALFGTTVTVQSHGSRPIPPRSCGTL